MPVPIAGIGEAIDRLITVPMSNWAVLKGLPVVDIYAEARRQVGGPLTLEAARRLATAASPGRHVIIITGFVIPAYGVAETDGPVGAATLARALDVGLGLLPILVTDPSLVDTVAACCQGVGLHACDLAEVGKDERGRRVAVLGFPLEKEKAATAARDMLERLDPVGVFAVERPGWNYKQVHHTGGGFDCSATTAKTDYLFLQAREKGILTVAMGDLGNELGMGSLAEMVRQVVPGGRQCLCSCGGGIACAVPADIPIFCNISNWGAYGVEAALAALLENEEILHDPQTERLALRAAAAAGAIDPVSGLRRPYADGESEDINACLIEMLHSIVRHRVRESVFTSSYRNTWSGKK